MFKTLRFALLALSLCMIPITAQAADQVIKVGLGDPINSDQGALGLRFKAIVEGLSDNKIKVELFPNCALGDETEMLQNVRSGSLDIAVVGIGQTVPFVKELGILTFPYLIESHYDAVRATTGRMGKWLDDRASKKGGFKILGWTYSNFRFLTNSKRPVTNLSEMKDLKIRTPQNNIVIGTLKSLGANPVPMAWAETFTAMQQGVVDGQDNPYIVNDTMKFQEIQKNLTEYHYQYSLQPMVIGANTFKKFSKETQDILIRAGIEAQQYCLLFQLMESDKAKANMIAAGVTVSTLTDEPAWKKLAIEKVWPQFYDFVGGKDVVDEALIMLEKN